MTRWTNEVNPFGQNRTPALIADASDGSGPVPLAADPATGRLLVNATGSSGGTSSTFGAAFPTTGTAVGASDGTNMQPLLVDGSGYLEVNVKAGGAGGTQYTDGGTPPTHPVGTMPIWNNTGTWSQVSAAAPLPVTANAGTNLNTSLLAIETGGNLATIAGLSLGQGSTTSAQHGVLVQGAVTTNGPSYTTGQTSPLSLDASGNLRINIVATTTGVNVPVQQSFSTMGTTDAVADSASYAQLSNGSAATDQDRIYLFNGTTWDRLRSAGAAAGTTGTGLLGTGILGYDGTNWQYAGIDSSHNLKVNVAAGGPTNYALETGGNLAAIEAVLTKPVLQDNVAQVGGQDVATTAPGTPLVSLAGPTGDPVDTTGDALNVASPQGIPLGASPNPRLGVNHYTVVTGLQTYPQGVNGLYTVKLGGGNIYGYNIYNNYSGPLFVCFWDLAVAPPVYSATSNTPPTFFLTVPAYGFLDSPPASVPIAFNYGLQVAFQALLGNGYNYSIASLNGVTNFNLWYK